MALLGVFPTHLDAEGRLYLPAAVRWAFPLAAQVRRGPSGRVLVQPAAEPSGHLMFIQRQPTIWKLTIPAALRRAERLPQPGPVALVGCGDFLAVLTWPEYEERLALRAAGRERSKG